MTRLEVFMTVGHSLTTGYTFRWIENLGHSIFYMSPLASIEDGRKILYNLDWFTKLSPLILVVIAGAWLN